MITFRCNHTTKDLSKVNISKMATIILSTISRCDMEGAIIKTMISMKTKETRIFKARNKNVENKETKLFRLLLVE